MPSLNDSNWVWRMLAASSDEIASMIQKKRHYPLLVGNKLIMLDPVSGGLNTVKDGSHNFRKRSGKSCEEPVGVKKKGR